MRTESGVRARGDNPRSRGPAPDLLRADLRSTIETASAPGGPPTAFHCSLVGARPCRLVPLRGSWREVADADPQPGRVGEALQLVTPQAGAGIVGPAGIGGDRQRLRVRVALRAELLPPVNDRANRELGGVARDPDAHPSLVCGQVVNAVGDRVPESLVLEVVAANLDRATLRLKLAADRLEIADQLTLLRVHADHRLASRKRLADGLGDVLELSVAVGMLRTLPRLLVRLQA